MPDLWLVRHGETEWSANGRHTGLTDVPLTPEGELQGEHLRRRLQGHPFTLVQTSPLRRARDTCDIAGYGALASLDPDLCEWNYGRYEGRTTAEIQARHPHWDLWKDGSPGGETVQDVGVRADGAIARALKAAGDVLIFAHAHFLRVLAARWLGLEPSSGRYLVVDTGSVSVLGHEHEHRAIRLWNDVSHLDDNR